jgi:hypothetical protein
LGFTFPFQTVKNSPVMKKFHLTPIIVAAAIGMTASLNAATSGVVGAYSVDVPTGPTIMSLGFLKSIDFQGVVSSNTGADLDMGTAVPVPTNASYVQVLDGAEQGRIIDIASVSGNVITLAAAPASDISGSSIAVREHMTLDDLGSTVPNFSTVTFLEPGGAPLVATKFITGWNTGGDTVIRPAEGFVINNSAVFTMTIYGAVSEDDVILEAAAGPAIVGFIDPVNGATDVVSTVAAGVPNFSTITALNPDGTPLVSTKFITGWNIDPATIDVSNYKSIVVNTAAGVDIVNAGMVVGP